MAEIQAFERHPGGKHDPGAIQIFYDNRRFKSAEDKMSAFQSYWLEGLCYMGWPSWETPDLEPGKIRLMWYTHAGNQGTRDYPLCRAAAVKEMFDSLTDEGFRPMILGFSGENPFPEIGGSEPPPEPKKPALKVASSASGAWSGHGGRGKEGETPHDRVMRIIEKEEEREAKARREEVEMAKKVNDLAV